MRRLQETMLVDCCWVLPALLGLPFVLGSTFTAVFSLFRLPLLQESKW